MGNCNKPSRSSRSLLIRNDVKISTKNIDDKLNNLSLEEWKKEILEQKKHIFAQTSDHSPDDEKDDIIHDDYDELISYLEMPFFASNCVSIVSIIARLIRIYSGNVVAKNLYNDKNSRQLGGYKISMAIHPLNCDIYITDSQSIFRLETTSGGTKDKDSYNDGCLIPIFRLPSNSNKLIKMSAFDNTHFSPTANITDIAIDSSGKFLFYIVNSNYNKTYFLEIENINININSNSNDSITTITPNKEVLMVDRSSIINNDKSPLSWDQLCFNRSIAECNFNHLNSNDTAYVERLSTYDSCRDLFWYKQTFLNSDKPRLFYDKENNNDICVDTRRMIICMSKQCFLDQLWFLNSHERRIEDDVLRSSRLIDMSAHFVNARADNVNNNVNYGIDLSFPTPKETKYSIPFATIIKQYCEKYCVKCANNDDKDYEKLYEKLFSRKYNQFYQECESLKKDDVSKMKCTCDDFMYDTMALGIDKYYNAIYIILKNKMLYRLELILNEKKGESINSNSTQDDNYTETKESELERKEMEIDRDDDSETKTNDQALLKEEDRFKLSNIDWRVTHRVNLRDQLSNTGGVPMGLCVIQYDSVLGRLIIADNFNIQALYI